MKTATFLLTIMLLLCRVGSLRLPITRTRAMSSFVAHACSTAATTSTRRRKDSQSYRLFATTEKVTTANTNIAEENVFDIELPSNENNEELLKIRHSTAHVMAMAVQQVHPEAKVTIGPWIDNG